MRSRDSLVPVALVFSTLACVLLASACSATPQGGGTGDDRGDPFDNADDADTGDDSGSTVGGDFDNATGSRTPPGGGTDDDSAGSGRMPAVDPMAAPFVQDDTSMSGLPAETLEQLKAGEGSGCDLELLYPYDGTVFPGGLLPPTLMWQGASEGAYVRMRYERVDPQSVDYQYANGPTSPGELRIPDAAWEKITRRTRNTPLRIELNVLRNGSVVHCETSWTIAPGTMIGQLLYNTYNAPDPSAAGQGAVMRMTLGERQADIYQRYTGTALPGVGPCIACHSVSANGSTMLASQHDYAAKLFTVSSYEMTDTPLPPPRSMLDNAVFAGLSPDGTKALASGNPDCTAGSDTFPRSANNLPLLEGPDTARLLSTETGEELATVGLDPEHYMWTPQFSPNGDKVVFNHAKPGMDGRTDRRELAIMDFDDDTNTFSNLQVIVSNLGPAPSLPYNPLPGGAGPVPTGVGGCTDTSGDLVGDTGGGGNDTCEEPCYPFWPFFTPDGKGVIFALTTEPDGMQAYPGRELPARSLLYYADVETGQHTPLYAAMGLNPDGSSYLPNPMDVKLDHYPTVLPVAVGGYYWVFWTSRRSYGHRLEGAGSVLDSLIDGGGNLAADSKKIWVSAIDIRGSGGDVSTTNLLDPSHPAFYLDGQSASGNVRAFATLNPCQPKGNTCTTGLDCCTRFCNIEEGETVGTCVEEPPRCAKLNEGCESDADCCPPEAPDDPTLSCLGGFCSFVVAPD